MGGHGNVNDHANKGFCYGRGHFQKHAFVSQGCHKIYFLLGYRLSW